MLCLFFFSSSFCQVQTEAAGCIGTLLNLFGPHVPLASLSSFVTTLLVSKHTCPLFSLSVLLPCLVIFLSFVPLLYGLSHFLFLTCNACTAQGSTNVAVRSAAIELAGVLHLHFGPSVTKMVRADKPALEDLLSTRYADNKGIVAPPPTRGLGHADANADADHDADADDASSDVSSVPSAVSKAKARKAARAAVPREDVSVLKIDDAIASLSDSAWKVRGAALADIGTALRNHPLLDGDAGSLASGLQGRLADNNKNHVITTLGHVTTLAGSYGADGEKMFVSHFLAGVLECLADAKVGHMHAFALSVCLS